MYPATSPLSFVLTCRLGMYTIETNGISRAVLHACMHVACRCAWPMIEGDEPRAWPAPSVTPSCDYATDDGHRSQSHSRLDPLLASIVRPAGLAGRIQLAPAAARKWAAMLPGPVPQQALRQLAPAHRASGPEQRQCLCWRIAMTATKRPRRPVAHSRRQQPVPKTQSVVGSNGVVPTFSLLLVPESRPSLVQNVSGRVHQNRTSLPGNECLA